MTVITEYTDPGCPFAFSAEPLRWRLQWLYGDQLEWRPRMVVLAESPDEYLEKGFDTERQAAAFKHLAEQYGMPIDSSVRPRMAATAPACRAVIAARLFAPELERPLLRRLRVRHFSGQLLDATETIEGAAADVGFDLVERPELDDAFEADKAAARAPTPAALAQVHKLAQWDGGMRYTCPSYEIEGTSVPGFQPWAAYEVALANVAPGLTKRDAPTDVTEVLRWAGTPLATREVAEVCGIEDREAREALGRVAVETHVGADGFWSLDAVDAL
jgi:predicted DsbA family dithiol-disulfide isomerase